MDRAFRKLSNETVCIDYRINRYSMYSQLARSPSCHFLLLQRGDWFPLALVNSINIPRFFWSSELFSRCRDHDHLLSSGLFEHVFMRTQSCIDAVVEKGWIKRERCSVLLSAYDADTHHPVQDVAKEVDLLFVGTITPRRKMILNELATRYNVKVVSAFGNAMADAVNRAKIVLNIHAEEFLDTETRVFEVLGCGAFLMSEYLSSENPFSEHDLVQWQHIPELIDKIGYYLQHETERAEIAAHGLQTAINNHTYNHRAQEILEVILHYVNADQEPKQPQLRESIEIYGYRLAEATMRIRQKTSTGLRSFMRG